MRQHGIVTSEHDPMYDAKRWLFWHSDIGITPRNVGDELRHRAEAHEAELDARNPLMCRFTKRVMKAIRNAQDRALDSHDMRTAEKLGRLYRKYQLRLVHYQHSEEENFYLFCPECFYSREEERRALIERYSGKNRD